MSEHLAITENANERNLNIKALLGIVVFNFLPIFGVLFWGWKSFDLIFLYWLENVIIGIAVLLRFAIKPYKQALELLVLCFVVPFFIVHYGMFCTVHGVFVMSLFADSQYQSNDLFNIYAQLPAILQANHLLYAALSLVGLQIFYWISDTYKYGWNNFGLGQLMVAPYRRIVILHIAIIGSAFALGSMNEPLVGLILLVLMKTAMDMYFWRMDDRKQIQKFTTASAA